VEEVLKRPRLAKIKQPKVSGVSEVSSYYMVKKPIPPSDPACNPLVMEPSMCHTKMTKFYNLVSSRGPTQVKRDMLVPLETESLKVAKTGHTAITAGRFSDYTGS